MTRRLSRPWRQDTRSLLTTTDLPLRLAVGVFPRLPLRLRRGAIRLIKPTYTVGVVAVVRSDDGRVLLVRQTYRDGWSCPGGLVNHLEHPRSAAVRECREEVGIRIAVLDELNVRIDPVLQKVDVVVAAELVDPAEAGRAEPRSPEIAECRWFSTDELPALQLDTEFAIRRLFDE